MAQPQVAEHYLERMNEREKRDLYIDSVERLMRTAKNSPSVRHAIESYKDALKELKEGIRDAEKRGKATPDVYAIFAKEARKCEKDIPAEAKGIRNQFEKLATNYEFKAKQRR